MLLKQASYLTRLRARGIARGEITLNDLFKPPFSLLNMAQVGIELFGENELKGIIEDLNATVFARSVA